MHDRQETGQKKAWKGPQIVDVGSVDEQTTAGVGNLGDFTGENKWKITTGNPPEEAKAVLPDGE